MLRHDHIKAFIYFFFSDKNLMFLLRIIGLPFVWGGYVKVISSEEFSFENINNLTSGKGLKILTVIFSETLSYRELDLCNWVIKARVFLE